MSLPNWEKVRSTYESGASLRALCKRFRISMRDLLAKIRAEKWERSASSKSRTVLTLPTVAHEKSSTEEEPIGHTLNVHKQVAKQLRMHFENELAEFQEMSLFMASFLDKSHIADLVAESHKDHGAALKAYLKNALSAFGQRMQVLQRLVAIGGTVIDRERLVLGVLDGKEAAENAQTWDDLLEDLRANKHKARELPAEVIDFEKKLASRKDIH